MIEPWFTLVLAEMAMTLTLLFRTPIRKPVTIVLDRMKQGRGPLIAKTVAGTLFSVLIAIGYSIAKIRKRSLDAGSVNPTDQVFLADHLLEASLLGFSLFLGLIIDRLHYYIKELRLLRMDLEAVKLENQGYEAMKSKQINETIASDEEMLAVRTKNKQLESKSKKI